MKPIILTLLLVTLVTPAICLGEWIKVDTSVKGSTWYIDFERIRERGGYVYYWELSDFAKPPLEDRLSFTTYNQVDCNLFRYKQLSWAAYKQPMGKGDIVDSSAEDRKRKLGQLPSLLLPIQRMIRQSLEINWEDPQSDSVVELHLRLVCDHVKSKKDKE